MCLVFTSDVNIVLDWMQDIIFCVPRLAPDQPPRKVIITTVALRSKENEPRPVYVYYAQPISGQIVYLCDTLRDARHWLNKLSVDRGQIRAIEDDGNVTLPSRSDVRRDSDSFLVAVNPEKPPPSLFQESDLQTFVERVGLANAPPPFTRIELPARAYRHAIMRFGFVIADKLAPSTNLETAFTFLGPHQISECIEQATDDYVNAIMRSSSGSETEKGHLIDAVVNARSHLRYARNNTLYDLILCLKPPHAMSDLNADDNLVRVIPPVSSNWIVKDVDLKSANDFEIAQTDDTEGRVLLRSFRTTSSAFSLGFTARVMKA